MILKKGLCIILSLCVVLFASGQNEKYSRVILEIEKKDLVHLTSYGLAAEGYFVNEGYVMELKESETALLKNNGYQVKTIIEDVKAFYALQNADFEGIESLKATKSLHCGGMSYLTPAGFGFGSMGGFYTYDEMLAELDSMHVRFPQLIKVKAPVDTFTTIEGRPVYWVRISDNPNVLQQGKKKIFYNALTHAREPASMQQMIFFMYFVLENYNIHPDITNIVNHFELYFIPCANPDGYIYNEQTDPGGGGLWRKNRRNNGDGTFGVDLNRNFGYMWGIDNQGSSPDGSTETYRGTAAFSEPETKILKHFCESHNFSVALNFHTYTNLLLYPFGYAPQTLTPDSLTFIAFADVLTSENNYAYGTAFEVLGYLGNGDSNDWMYGEQQTKNKIISFTPEVGAPAFGFWPPMNEIINMCNDNMKKNIFAAYLAGKYARITDLSNKFVEQTQAYFKYNIQNIGLDSMASFTVSLVPVSSNISYTGSPQTYTGLNHLQYQTDSIALHLHSNTLPGEEIVFVVVTHNGSYAINDTVRKYAGQRKLIFYDDCSSMDNWTSNSWDVTTDDYFSAPASITDSPNGNYQANVTHNISLLQPIDLTQTQAAYLQFRGKWFMAYSLFGSYYDYVQLLISTDNGTNWTPLCGKHTSPSNNSQILGQPAYETYQTEWVLEEIVLNDYTGQNVLFRFQLKSDWLPWTKDDGFYFDDFTVYAADSLLITHLSKTNTVWDIEIFPNPTTDYVNILFKNTAGDAVISLYDALGQEVISETIKANGNHSKARIDLSGLPQGLYFLKIANFSESIFQKVLKL